MDALSQLSPAKQALLARRLRGQVQAGGAMIRRHAGNDPAPLSLAQQRLWLLEQLDPGRPVYNGPARARIHGALDLAALRRTFSEIVRRHAVLRTRFVVLDGVPYQVASPAAELPLPAVDLSGLPEPARAGERQRLGSDEASRPFDLERGPVLRLTLLRLGPREHLLLVTLHHIVSDAWSVGVLLREMSALYEAYAAGRTSPLPELPIQYSDFARWQRQRLSPEVLEAGVAHWRRRLEGAPAILELPADRPRPLVQTSRGGRCALALPQPLSAALAALARAEETTLFMLLLAAFQVLLARCSGQEDIPVGTPVAGRSQPELENLIGFFVNTLVLRGQVAGESGFRKLLAQVRETTLEAFAHQEVPFDRLVEELRPERNLSHTPLFQILFVLQNVPFREPVLPGLAIEFEDVDSGTAKFDLSLELVETGGEVVGALEYNRDLFDASRIARLARHFQVLLEGIAARPESRIDELPLLSVPERHHLLAEWNDTAAEYPGHEGIADLFDAWVEQSPEAPAVVFGEEELTYRELCEAANRLAHRLLALGVGPGVPVGLCLERSAAAIVAILAIVKAGGVYVPLDPTFPPERLAWALADIGAAALVTREGLLGPGLLADPSRIVCLDRDRHALAKQSPERPPGGAGGDDPVYVLYTSGSTGRPKGVVVPHRAVLRLVRNSNYVQFSPEERLAQLSNLAFDAVTFEIWGALLNGGRLCGISKEVLLSPHEFESSLCELGITALFLTATLFNQVAREVPQAFRFVRHLLVGGEALDPPSVRRVLGSAAPPVRLLNGFGPTESTTFACWHRIDAVPEGARSIPIGRPLSNTRAHVLDRAGQMLPIGSLGELFLGGDGLAGGYPGRPDLTAERFVPDPFSTEPGGRLYRTGDLVRLLPSGEIDYLGRNDHQVKIRGFRIELGEIEAVLGAHPAVGQAVVVAREDTPGEKRLVAYVVPAQGAAYAIDELRSFLAQRLPVFMVPAAFVTLERFPLNVNGKVDRQCLPAPEAPPHRPDERLEGPRDELEQRLASLWQELLQISQVGLGDDFFELGGHSLLLVRLLERIERDFGTRPAVNVFLQEPTLEGLARTLRCGIAPAARQVLVTLQPGRATPPLFCIHPVSGTVSCYFPLARHLGPVQTVYALQAPGVDTPDWTYPSIETLAAHYVEAIRTVAPHPPYLLAGWSFGGVVAFEMAQQLVRLGLEVGLLAMLDSRPPAALVRLVAASDSALMVALAREHAHQHGEELPLRAAEIEGLGDEAQAQRVVDALRQARLELPEQGVAWLRRLLAVFGSGIRVAAAYAPTLYPGKITLFQAAATDPGNLEDLPEVYEQIPDDPTAGWQSLSAQPVEVVEVPGEHATLGLEPNVQILAQHLTAAIGTVTGGGTSA
jgi:amino acid adenylation domain-containing protein